MIQIDRASSLPVVEQLVQQLRFQIVSGRYRVGETMPSTRALAEAVGVSFHSVRKAYQQLEREGLLGSRVGSGFRVRQRDPLRREDRLEQGAAVLQEALRKLIGLGLRETELEYLFQEQLTFLDRPSEGRKIVFAGRYREYAEAAAGQLSAVLQERVEPAGLDALRRHQDADQVIAAYPELRQVREILPDVELSGVLMHLRAEALERVAALLPSDTLAVACLYRETVEPLLAEIRRQTGFSGQVIAAPVEGGPAHLGPMVDLAELLVYTAPSRRRLLPLLAHRRHALLGPVVSSDSLEWIRQNVPG